MKKYLNYVIWVLIILTLLFKSNYLPGGNYLIALSSLLMLSSLFIYCYNDNLKAGMSKGMNLLFTAGLAILILDLAIDEFWKTFADGHWPGSQVMTFASYFVVISIPMLTMYFKEKVSFSYQYILLFFFYLLQMGILLPKNPFIHS